MSKKKKNGTLTNRYKKQHGLHHKHSDKYLKVYWPYIPVLMLVITGISMSIIIILNKPSTSIGSTNISATNLLSQTNQLRKSSDLSSLQLNPQLSTAAQEKANDMAVRNYWSPISPSGQTPWQIIKSTGYQYQTAGENLAYGFSTSSTLFSAWDNSVAHKDNMINSNFSDVGFGIAKAPDYQGQGPETIVVALYASTNTPTSTVSNQKTNETFTTASISEPKNQAVVRAESYTGTNNNLSIFIIGLATGVICCFLIIRHGLVFKKWVTEGEQLIIKHPFYDVTLVVILLGVASLSQTIGFIR
jgi:hypothetical protein